MVWLTTALRRSLWLVLIAAAGGAVWSYRRDSADGGTPAPAEWPPISTPTQTTTSAAAPAPAPASTPTPASETHPSAPVVTPAAKPATTDAATSNNSSASFVNALVDAPEARSADGAAGGWAPPSADGSCPDGYPVKANDNSGIFHMPGGRFYDRTKAERCYSDAEAAIADGYRRAKN